MQSNKFKDEELEAFPYKYYCQTQEGRAQSLWQSFTQGQGIWVAHETKLRDIERRQLNALFLLGSEERAVASTIG